MLQGLHLCEPETKTVIGGERKIDIWTLKPGSENHWLDCIYNKHVVGSWCGARSIPVREAPKQKRSGGSLSEKRAAKRRQKS